MDSARRSRNRIVLVVVLVIEPRHSIEDEDENEEEKFARTAKILRDSSTNLFALENRVVCEQGYMISLAGVALPDI